MNIEVPFIDLKARFIEEKDELLSTVNKVLSQGSLVLTNELKEFEEDVQQYTKAKHCIGLNSGTDALMMGFGQVVKKRRRSNTTSNIFYSNGWSNCTCWGKTYFL